MISLEPPAFIRKVLVTLWEAVEIRQETTPIKFPGSRSSPRPISYNYPLFQTYLGLQSLEG